MTELRTHTVSGAKWAMTARTFRALLGIGVLAALSRFLTADEFGVMALILFSTMLAQIFADFGMRMALIQRREITAIDQDTVFWSNVAAGTAVTGLIWIFAGPISSGFGVLALEEPLRAVSPIFLISALQGASATVLERRFDFNRIAQSEIASALIGAATVTGLVIFAKWRIEAVVAQQLAYAGANLAMIAAFARWRPRLRWSYASFRSLISYGGYVTMANTMQFMATNADRPIIGRQLSATDLGYFSLANQVIMSPLLIIVQMVRKVMFPVLSSIQNDDARMRRVHLQVEHALMLVMAPICLGIAAMAGPFVHVVLGPRWEPVIPVLVLMALRTLLNPINDLNSVLVAAKGHARFQFRWSVMTSIASIGTLLLSVPYGLEVAMTARLALALVTTPAYASFAFPLIGQSWIAFGKALLAPVASATAMYLVVRALDGAMAAAELSDPLRLIICIPTGAAVYAGLLLTVDRRRSLDLLRTLTRRRTKP